MIVETKFNALDILRIAEEVEHRYMMFYLKVEASCEDAELRTLCRLLADQKAAQKSTFTEMRKRHRQHNCRGS